MTTDLMELASRVEAGEGPDRELDLAIHLALDPDGQAATRIKFGTRGLTGEGGQRWELSRGALLYEQRDERGNCWANGGIPIAAYTASLDAAMTLIPGAEMWDVSRESADTYTADLTCFYRGNVDYEPDADKVPFGRAKSPALALTAAALRARAHQGTAHVEQ